MNRRELLKTAAALPLVPTALSGVAFAQGPFPSRNVTMIVPFPPGGQADLAARPVALALERILGKPVIVHPVFFQRRMKRWNRSSAAASRF